MNALGANQKHDRDRFMDRVRGALGRSRTVPPPEPAPPVNETIVRLADHADDLLELFSSKAQGAGMTVHRLHEVKLVGTVLDLLTDLKAKQVVVDFDCDKATRNLERSLRDAGIGLVSWQDGDQNHQFDADAALTDVHAALAETGTLVCSTDADHVRGASLIPPVHLAMVRSSDILPDMIDFLSKLQDRSAVDLPSSLSFITGPSKTSDIEGKLVTGVHGPGQVHVLLVEGA